jgi:hypothetical protein
MLADFEIVVHPPTISRLKNTTWKMLLLLMIARTGNSGDTEFRDTNSGEFRGHYTN